MFANRSAKSKKSATPKSRSSSTIGCEDATAPKYKGPQHSESQNKILSVFGEGTPIAKRLRLADAFDKTESELATNSLYLEPKAPFPLQMLEARDSSTEVADLKFRLESLTKKHEARVLEFKITLSKKQAEIEKKDIKIEDLEKSIVYLDTYENERQDRIKELEEENAALKESVLVYKGSETHLKDKICVLEEKLVNCKGANKEELDKSKAMRQELTIKLDLLDQEKKLFERKLKKVTSELASRDKVEQIPQNTEGVVIDTLNRQLNSLQERCIALQQEKTDIALALSNSKAEFDKYEVLREQYTTLERKSAEFESEIYELQKQLLEIDSNTKTWAAFFSKNQEFDTIDSLWKQYKKNLEQLNCLVAENKYSGDRAQQLEEEVDRLKQELQKETESSESINKLFNESRLSLLRFEKLNVFANKEIELLRKQLEISSAIADSSKDQVLPIEVSKLLDEARQLNESLAKELKSQPNGV